MSSDTLDAYGAFSALIRHPEWMWRRWNWKAAIMSATVRGAIFFAANLPEGAVAAQSAFATEFALRALTSGFYGTVTQSFRCVEPRWQAVLSVLVVVPVVSHSIEFAVHWAGGTEALVTSIGTSVAFTVFSSAFNLHLMRHGVMTVGAGSQSFGRDLRAMPRLILEFFGFRNARRLTSRLPTQC